MADTNSIRVVDEFDLGKLGFDGMVPADIHLNLFLTVPPSANTDKELRDFWGKVGAVRAREAATRCCTTIQSTGQPCCLC